MTPLKICDIGLSDDASHAFHSMLKIVDGRANAVWQLADIDHADVLIAHVSSDAAALHQWNRSGKPVIAVVDDRDTWPPSPFVLRHPFRVMQLLAMLDRIAEHVRAPRGTACANGSPWAAAESLRALGTQAGVWHVTHDEHGRPLWIGEGRAHAAAQTLSRLRSGPLRLDLFMPAPDRPPDDAEHLALGDAAWFVGLHGPDGLPPWLAAQTPYRLRRWPDLGRLGAEAPLVELVARTAARAHTAGALAEIPGQTPGRVHRFLAAASLCGLLVAAPQASASAAQVETTNGWSRFVGSLRRQLGLVA